MAELEAYSALIAEIYDAALDTSRWQPTLKLAGDFVGGVSGSLFWHDSAAGNVSVLSVADEDAKVTRTYVEHYARLNPVFPAATFLEPGIVYAATDIVPYDDFVGTRFYQEWVKPQGVLDAIAANLERSATASAMVAFRLRTDDSPAGEEPRRKLGLLVPHIKRAAAIGRLLEQHAARARALSTTFDRISAAVFLVDRKGRTVYANASGDALTAERRLVRNDMGRLVAADAAADRELQDALKAAARGDAAMGIRGSQISLAEPLKERWFAHVLPLTDGARRAEGENHQATAAVFIRKAALDTPSALARVAERYRLTGTEVRALMGVMDATGVSDIARDMGVSQATVKTHLQRIFAKTGARRQLDLVKLVAEHAASPFAGQAPAGR